MKSKLTNVESDLLDDMKGLFAYWKEEGRERPEKRFSSVILSRW